MKFIAIIAILLLSVASLRAQERLPADTTANPIPDSAAQIANVVEGPIALPGALGHCIVLPWDLPPVCEPRRECHHECDECHEHHHPLEIFERIFRTRM